MVFPLGVRSQFDDLFVYGGEPRLILYPRTTTVSEVKKFSSLPVNLKLHFKGVDCYNRWFTKFLWHTQCICVNDQLRRLNVRLKVTFI